VTTTTTLVLVTSLVLVTLVGLLVLLLSALRSTSRTVGALTDRLTTLEARTGHLHHELAEIDEGLDDVAAALREHRTDADAGADAEHGA
jgi:hypothetical protein